MSITKATALDLASRNDGYLVRAGDPDIAALKDAGLVFTRPAGEGYWIARVIVVAKPSYHGFRTINLARRAAQIGAATV